MARANVVYFNPHTPPTILVPLRVTSVERYSRQLFQIRGHVGDYEVVVRRAATDLPGAPTTLMEMQVTRLERFTRDKMVTVWGYVGDYEASVALPSVDGRVRSLLHLHTLGQQLAAAGTDR